MDEQARSHIMAGIYGDKSTQSICEVIVANGVDGLAFFYNEIKKGKAKDKSGKYDDIMYTSMINLTVTPLDGDGKIVVANIPMVKSVITDSIAKGIPYAAWKQLIPELRTYMLRSNRYKGIQPLETPYGYVSHMIESLEK
jgi:hypothetical protein